MFLGEFSNKQCIIKEFQLEDNALNDCAILFATYDIEGYEGSALILFVKQGKIYIVEGSHCSCMGLEGQFDAEEISPDALKKMCTGNGILGHWNQEITKILTEMSMLDLLNLPADQLQTWLALQYS